MASAKKSPVQAAAPAQGNIQRTAPKKSSVAPPVKAASPAPAKPARSAAQAKPPKVKTPKPVRDRYTLPAADYAALVQLKARSAALGQVAKKNQLLRAGILALAGMGDSALLDALKAAPPRKG